MADLARLSSTLKTKRTEVETLRKTLADVEQKFGKRSEQAKEAQEALVNAEHEHGNLVRSLPTHEQGMYHESLRQKA